MIGWGALRRRADARGQGIVEFTYALPILLLILVGMVELGMAYNDTLTLGYATREGARVGSALGNGGAASCNGGADPAGVDASIVAAVQRIIMSPGSDVEPSRIAEIRIYRATETGAISGGLVNRWRWAPGRGPDVDPGAGAARLDFAESARGWSACGRVANGRPDALGVQIVYSYRLRTPLGALMAIFGQDQGPTFELRDQTVMSLNPA
ncbi:MAG: TadE/TadG family type IV pilus assembly protein [Chloroflexota bacterium]